MRRHALIFLGFALTLRGLGAGVDLHFAGFARFLESGELPTLAPDEAKLFAVFQDPAVQAELAADAMGFFGEVAEAHPELDLRVVPPGSAEILGEDLLGRACFVALALDNVVSCAEAFPSGAVERHYYLSLPLYVIRAKSYELLYARPYVVHLPLPEGVTLDHPEVPRLLVDAVKKQFFESDYADSSRARAADAFERGTFRSPFRPTYAIDLDGIRLSDATAEAIADAVSYRQLLQMLAGQYLGAAERVLPPLRAKPSGDLYAEAGARYGLAVITNLEIPGTRTANGYVELPLNYPQPGLRLEFDVRTGHKVLEEAKGKLLQKAACQVCLDVSEKTLAGKTVAQYTLRATRDYPQMLGTANASEPCFVKRLCESAKLLSLGSEKLRKNPGASDFRKHFALE